MPKAPEVYILDGTFALTRPDEWIITFIAAIFKEANAARRRSGTTVHGVIRATKWPWLQIIQAELGLRPITGRRDHLSYTELEAA